VPAFIVADRYRIVGAHPYPQLAASFRQIQASWRPAIPEAGLFTHGRFLRRGFSRTGDF